MDTPPAKGKGDGLLLILLLAVFFAATAADPAFAQVQLPAVNLGDTNLEDGFGAPGWFLEEFPGGYTAGELKDSKRENGSWIESRYHLQHDQSRSLRLQEALPPGLDSWRGVAPTSRPGCATR